MQCFILRIALIAVGLCFGNVLGGSASAEPTLLRDHQTTVDRALSFLSREVPRWSVENKCFSCHNNGDAARTLYTAIRLGFSVDADALADTSRWLSDPDSWEHNGGEGEYNDKKLAAIQFSSALVEAIISGAVEDKSSLMRAASIVAGFQQADGSWAIDAKGNLGSPITYGPFLATAVSRRVLATAGRDDFASQIDRADTWLRANPPKTVVDAAGVLIGLHDSSDDAAARQRQSSLELIRKGQAKTGGWGPFVTSRREPFDTAIVLLALRGLDDFTGRRRMIDHGRQYLVDCQLADGSWPPTTRPAGAQSYAHRISTTGWAALALLATIERVD